MLTAYKSDNGRRTEATILTLENYIRLHDVFISTCNNVEIERQEAASNSNSGELGPFSPTPELNRALSELIDYSESDARYGVEDQVVEEQHIITTKEEVEHNMTNEIVEAAEETMDDNTAEETVEGITAERKEHMELDAQYVKALPVLPDYCPFCNILYDKCDHCPLCENMIASKEEAKHNTADETFEAAEETVEVAEETVEGFTAEWGPVLPDYCPFCELLYDMYDHCPLCET